MNMILFGNRVFADDPVKMRSVGPDPMWPCRKGKFGHRDKERMPGEDWCYVATVQRTTGSKERSLGQIFS